MRALFYDTETTGLPLFNEPSNDPRQPHLVQLAAILVDLDTRRELASIDLTIRPDGWVIPDETAAIHGITTEIAAAHGVSEFSALSVFDQLWSKADFRVAHNEDFDARIMRITYLRCFTENAADEWKAGNRQCTCALATPIMNLPPTERMVAKGMRGPKKPNLAEALRFFTGRELENAHSARADTLACRDVFFAIRDGLRAPVAA